jgi:hypothetical protein
VVVVAAVVVVATTVAVVVVATAATKRQVRLTSLQAALAWSDVSMYYDGLLEG